MLASTVQFSRYGRIRSCPHRGVDSIAADRSVQNRPDEEAIARSLRTQQRTYGHHARPWLVPARTEVLAVLIARVCMMTELISVPPMS